jgi:hypothetical protein
MTSESALSYAVLRGCVHARSESSLTASVPSACGQAPMYTIRLRILNVTTPYRVLTNKPREALPLPVQARFDFMLAANVICRDHGSEPERAAGENDVLHSWINAGPTIAPLVREFSLVKRVALRSIGCVDLRIDADWLSNRKIRSANPPTGVRGGVCRPLGRCLATK